MSQMFQYEVWSPSLPHELYTVDDFIDGDFTLGKVKLNWKILLYVFLFFFLSGALTVYSVSAR